uniref:Uncharacterized protein n=1 Tax=Anguilla anguilla TaxID=7936 RepID=A0A0E9R8J5_ANGAN
MFTCCKLTNICLAVWQNSLSMHLYTVPRLNTFMVFFFCDVYFISV